ncbi:unextended protein isoform X2 [Phymastichus coffea]|uniref:unextended protein isoform X2 n=1 Tax=Phymastichus coffea TaxID=108790 RepID=UPI00273AF107|nr:unextended protein isoform X2 [Phymastichus coffea]
MAQHESSSPVLFLICVFIVQQALTNPLATIQLKSVQLLSDHGNLLELVGYGLNNSIEQLSLAHHNDCRTSVPLKRIELAEDGTRAVYKEDHCLHSIRKELPLLCVDGIPSSVEVQLTWQKLTRKRRALATDEKSTRELRIEGILVEKATKLEHDSDGTTKVLALRPATLRIFGVGITNTTQIAFSDSPGEHGAVCDSIKSGKFQVRDVSSDITALVDVLMPVAQDGQDLFYVCALQTPTDGNFKFQGSESYKTISSYQPRPLWLSIMIIVACLCCSAMFSGLNLGLLSLDPTDLKILCNCGTEKEKQYAKTIQPVRAHGNYLLCSILFSNVLVNAIFTVILEELTTGIAAVIGSTLAIVIIGEIAPQAICSRYGLFWGAHTIYATKLTMLLTFPLSYPISKILDFILGVEIGNVYNRDRLKELVKVTTDYNDLEKDEVNIISGALELRKKTVADVMTRIEDVYMLDYNRILDFETVSEIMSSGFSRIPVYEGNRTNIVTMLYIKDLAFVDPDDNMPLRTLCQFYQYPCNFVFEDVTLDVMFKQFKEGHKGHMAFVQRVNSEGEGDPFYEVIGLVTLEDVIEELIQAEILDETDVFTDNRSKRKRTAHAGTKKPDFTVFAERKENQRIHISPQLLLATFQYLSTSVDAFKPDSISEPIVRRLLKQDIIYHIKVKSREKARNDPTAVIYQQGKAVDYFVLILEGRVEVTVGKENLMFESGPFTYFGTQALTANVGIAGAAESPTNSSNPQTLGSIQSVNLDAILRHTFVPDYTVRAITEVFYVKVKRSLYLAAKRATLLERSQKEGSQTDQFDAEVEKLLHSLDEDDRSMPESPILPKDKDDNNPNGQLKNSPVKTSSSPSPREQKLDLDAEISVRQLEAARLLSLQKTHLGDEIEERTILLDKQQQDNNC